MTGIKQMFWNYYVEIEIDNNNNATIMLLLLQLLSAIIMVTLYFKVSFLQCNYTFKYLVIFINHIMYTLYG